MAEGNFKGSETSETLSLDEAVLKLARAVGEGLDVRWPMQQERDFQRREAGRQRIAAADAREAEAMGAVRAPGRKALKKLDQYNREKPTIERAAMGVFDVVDAQKFDTSRDKERVLMDWASRAGGAGEMYVRGQIKPREMRAAAMLCELWERSQTSQLSGVKIAERVDGGAVDISGGRLIAAGQASGEYRDALECLSRAGRALVEARVVRGMAMDNVVRLRSLDHRLGDGSPHQRSKYATKLLADALDLLADRFGLAGD